MEDYAAFGKRLAYEAGAIMLQYFQIGVATEIKTAEGNTPVTAADKAINKLVIDRVQATYSTHAVLGEEQSLPRENAPYIWVCDPIDGTIPYSAGIPTNVFSLALVDQADGQPKVAVVHDPYMKRLYHAVAGQGAFLNDTPIHVNQISDLAQAIIGTSSSRSTVVDSPALKSELSSKCFRQLIFNSTIYEAMLVASGQIAAQLFVGYAAHDVAAAMLIVKEAGGTVTALLGDEQRYDMEVKGALMTNGLLHDEIVELARQHKLIV